jgi:peptidoglycan biosynthesis protein MviN/MurJ (putative lipid II flippase)
MVYSKVYYALLDLNKVVIFACFNVMINIEFKLFNR